VDREGDGLPAGLQRTERIDSNSRTGPQSPSQAHTQDVRQAQAPDDGRECPQGHCEAQLTGGADTCPQVLGDAETAKGFEARARREVWSGVPSAAHLDPERPTDALRSREGRRRLRALVARRRGLDSGLASVQGPPASVLFRRPLETCVTACERDHVLRFTNEVLARSGSDALAAPDPP
jgi:hypothetical protein